MRLVPIACLALALAPSAQSLYVVDRSGAGDFLQIQEAVDAASPGDVIVVNPGVYDPITVSKGVTILAPTFGPIVMHPFATGPSMPPPVRVVGLPAGESFVLSGGLQVFNSLVEVPYALEVVDCDGPVWIQDVFVDSYGAPALRVASSRSVVLVDGLYQTNLMPAAPDGSPLPGPGATVEDLARVFVHGAAFHGSHGTLIRPELPDPTAPSTGGAGLLVRGATVELHGASVGGGSGGSYSDGTCTFGGDGGPGLLLQAGTGAEPAVLAHASTLVGGFAGFAAACAPPGEDGAPQVIEAGAVTADPSPLRAIDAPRVVLPSTTLDVGVQGAAGELAILYAASRPGPTIVFQGLAIQLRLGAQFHVANALLPAGSATISVPLPPLAAGQDVIPVAFQALYLGAGGSLRLSGPVEVVVR